MVPMDWTLTLKVSASSYETLRVAVTRWQDRMAEIISFTDLWTANETIYGGEAWSFHTECTSPVEVRIRALREEADRLEKELRT
jgi:hypothetical protein